MFWKKKAKCLVTPEDKKWIEDSLDWIDKHLVKLSEQITIEPTKEFFNWVFTNEEQDAEFVFKKVGEYFKIRTNKVELKFYSEADIELGPGLRTRKVGGGSAGLYTQRKGKYTIWIEQGQLKRPDSLIATIAHELSHYVLMGQKNIYIEGDENEWLTDLLAIAYGFGVFLGNGKFKFDKWQNGDGWSGWSMSSQGYLPQEIIAHAMAEIEYRRSTEIPTWSKHLVKGLKSDFECSLRFLLEQ